MRTITRVAESISDLGTTLSIFFEIDGIPYATGGVDKSATSEEIQAIVDTCKPCGPLQQLERIDLVAGKANSIDVITSKKIGRSVHPVSGIGEQIGILRDQIARMLNGDMVASEGFLRLNEIAIAEIEKGQIEKEAL